MAFYDFTCEKCGDIKLDLKLGTAKETDICPNCRQEIKRNYSPIGNVWKCDGAFGRSK